MMESVERVGRVVGFDGDQAKVLLEVDSACGSCGSRGSCSSEGKAMRVVRMPLPADTKLGDRVSVSTSASSVALAALLGYLLPAAALLVGAIVGASQAEGDIGAVLGAGAGLFVGLLLARLIFHPFSRRGVEPAVCESNPHPGELQ